MGTVVEVVVDVDVAIGTRGGIVVQVQVGVAIAVVVHVVAAGIVVAAGFGPVFFVVVPDSLSHRQRSGARGRMSGSKNKICDIPGENDAETNIRANVPAYQTLCTSVHNGGYDPE